MTAIANSVVREVSGIRPGSTEVVRFPVEQPGMSALIGFFELDGQRYVLKLLKTEELREWAERTWGMHEPRLLRVVRRVSARWDSLTPRPALWPTLERFNASCQTWLGSVSPEVAAEALGQAGASADEVEALIAELFAGRHTLCFAPRSSESARVSLSGGELKDLLALVQEDLAPNDRPAVHYRQPIRRRSWGRGERRRQLEFLVLASYATVLASRHGLGLDLGPRVRSGALVFPNVLARSDTRTLAYVDSFGLAQRDGNRVEAAAFAALYGRHGLIRGLVARTYKGLMNPGREGRR